MKTKLIKQKKDNAKERLSRKQRYILLTILECERLRKDFLKGLGAKGKWEYMMVGDIMLSCKKKGEIPNPSRIRWDGRKPDSFYKKNREIIAKKINFVTALSYAKKLTHKKSVYRALHNLEKKGLVTIEKKGTKIINVHLKNKVFPYCRTNPIKKSLNVE